MFNTRIKNLVKGLALVSAMMFSVILVSASTANAQNRDYRNDRGRYDRDDDRGRYDRDNDQDDRYNNDRYNQNDRYNGRDRNGNQSVRFAYQRGYQAGLRQARQDARSGYGNGRYNNGGYGNYGGYNNTDPYSNSGSYGNGNRNGWGNSAAFRQAYQNGYNRGYRDGLNRNRNNRRGSILDRLPF